MLGERRGNVGAVKEQRVIQQLVDDARTRGLDVEEALIAQQEQRIRALVRALRSEHYEQGQRRLARLDEEQTSWGYCCLGVACEVAMIYGAPISITVNRAVQYAMKQYAYVSGPWSSTSTTSLPGDLSNWFGFGGDSAPKLQVPPYLVNRKGPLEFQKLAADVGYSAIDLNDSFHLTFAEIADCFEYTYLPNDWIDTVAQANAAELQSKRECQQCADGAWHVVCN